MSKRGPINYDIEVWCHKCSEKHQRSDCEFRPKFGWKCPDCGNKCRSKPKYNKENKDKLHPYIPHKTHVYMTTELKQFAKERKGLV